MSTTQRQENAAEECHHPPGSLDTEYAVCGRLGPSRIDPHRGHTTDSGRNPPFHHSLATIIVLCYDTTCAEMYAQLV